MKASATVRERFFAKLVAHPSGCILWTGCVNKGGYGEIGIGHRGTTRVKALAHRVSWFLKFGRWPLGDLMHSCDTPACVRPSHLNEGTIQQNMADKVTKGRQLKGTRIHSSKLTEADVREIRRLCTEESLTYSEIGKRFGLNIASVCAAHTRRSWKWLDQDTPRQKKRTLGQDVRDLAARAGLTTSAIKYRLAKGLTGTDLIRPKHRAPRKTYTRRK